MSEKIQLEIASRESVALKLAMEIANKEKLYDDSATYRQRFLDLYAECLAATGGYRDI